MLRTLLLTGVFALCSFSLPSQFFKGMIYFASGRIFHSAAECARVGWSTCVLFSKNSATGQEWLLFSSLCRSAAKRAFLQAFQLEGPCSYQSWNDNESRLAHIPVISKEEEEFLAFLKRRWLAKSSGFFRIMVDWVCPCFGFSIQIHPETTCSYARDPASQVSRTYLSRIEQCKERFPHFSSFPLLLTRPQNIQEYLPLSVQVLPDEESVALLKRANGQILDFSQWFSEGGWLKWESYKQSLLQACEKLAIDPSQLLCMHTIEEPQMGGIRLLPLAENTQEAFLLRWISCFGLTANRIELDRIFRSSHFLTALQSDSPAPDFKITPKEHLSFIIEKTWEQRSFTDPSVAGLLQVLKGLSVSLSEERWRAICQSPARIRVAQLSLSKIQEGLRGTPTVSQIEELHAHLSALLETFVPFSPSDFPSIYQQALSCVPQDLKLYLSAALHSSAMTSVGGILKAVEKTIGKRPRILYGENTYFECIQAFNYIGDAAEVSKATSEDWKHADLLFAQFNPVLKRAEGDLEGLQKNVYQTEKISEMLRCALNIREQKPITIAIDCTFDVINSSKLSGLLDEFQKEIHAGTLNIICYRSGLKFDLFGMDNYCGAPFLMIHNRSEKWIAFDRLCTDPALQTDRLSLQWFCLAYKHALIELEQYQRQIIDNTRNLLGKVPSRLFSKDATYRIIPIESDVDPSFIEVQVSGRFHKLRSAALVGGSLFMRCMEHGHPIFNRRSLGFYHPNFSILFGETCSIVRLTLGLDPTQVEVLAECFQALDKLNETL